VPEQIDAQRFHFFYSEGAMLRSVYDEECELVLQEKHVEEVWFAIAQSFKRYFDRFVEHELLSKSSAAAAIATLGSKYKIKDSKVDPAPTLRATFQKAIDEYQREAAMYRGFFNEESLQEYEELDAKEFKRALRDKRNCPIIYNCVNSQRKQMHDWQRKFQARDPRPLRTVFRELFLAAEEYAHELKPANFEVVNELSELRLERFDEDEDLRAEGIVGTGIKSAVLYHLHPDIFPSGWRMGLYALYFMSGSDKNFELSSNEFIMVNDLKAEEHITDIEHNYWYPYSLYTLYQLRLHRLLSDACSKLKVSFDPKYRFVYNDRFLKHVTEVPPESELMDAMHAPREELW
jgi:hypothetical protein